MRANEASGLMGKGGKMRNHGVTDKRRANIGGELRDCRSCIQTLVLIQGLTTPTPANSWYIYASFLYELPNDSKRPPN